MFIIFPAFLLVNIPSCTYLIVLSDILHVLLSEYIPRFPCSISVFLMFTALLFIQLIAGEAYSNTA